VFRLFRRKAREAPPPSSGQMALQFEARPDTTLRPAHPTAPIKDQRVAMLRHQPVRWELVRSARRTIGFQIDARGLRVSAPRWVPIWEIEKALDEKADWILRKLLEWQQHERRREDLQPRWEHGALIRLLGETLTLTLDPASRGAQRDGDLLRIGLPLDAPPDDICDAAQRWLKEQARAVFAERIPIYSQRLGRAPTRWALSSARTRWGSCNPDGSIRLNWRLIHFPLEVVDYVIAHEMAHLLELNHGPKFWFAVEALFPDYERVRGMLRHHYDDAPES